MNNFFSTVFKTNKPGISGPMVKGFLMNPTSTLLSPETPGTKTPNSHAHIIGDIETTSGY